MNVRATIERLAGTGVRIHCLALRGVDLTSAAGKMTMGVLNAVPEFERDLLIEHTQAGLARAKLESKVLGRPTALPRPDQAEVLTKLIDGASIAQFARGYDTGKQSIMRARDRAMNRKRGNYV